MPCSLRTSFKTPENSSSPSTKLSVVSRDWLFLVKNIKKNFVTRNVWEVSFLFVAHNINAVEAKKSSLNLGTASYVLSEWLNLSLHKKHDYKNNILITLQSRDIGSHRCFIHRYMHIYLPSNWLRVYNIHFNSCMHIMFFFSNNYDEFF